MYHEKLTQKDVERLQEENFHDKSCCEKNYPQKDYHDVYIAEIEKVLISASFSNIR